jgi:hypothetical protein
MLSTRLNRFWLRPTLFAVIGCSGLMLLQAQSSCETGPIQPVINITNSNCNVNGATGDCSNSTANGGAGTAGDGSYWVDAGYDDSGAEADTGVVTMEGAPCENTLECLVGLDQCSNAVCDNGVCRLTTRLWSPCYVNDPMYSCVVGTCYPSLYTLFPGVCVVDILRISQVPEIPNPALYPAGGVWPGTCFIDQKCWNDGDRDPANTCRSCQRSGTDWTVDQTWQAWAYNNEGQACTADGQSGVCAPPEDAQTYGEMECAPCFVFTGNSWDNTETDTSDVEETTDTDDATSDTGTSTTDTTTEATDTTTDGEGSSGDTTTDTTTNATSTTTDGEGNSGDTTSETSTTGDSTGTTTGE